MRSQQPQPEEKLTERPRRGLSLLEVVVSLAIFTAAMAVLMPAVAGHIKAHRAYADRAANVQALLNEAEALKFGILSPAGLVDQAPANAPQEITVTPSAGPYAQITLTRSPDHLTFFTTVSVTSAVTD